MTWHPSRALNLASSVASGTSELEGLCHKHLTQTLTLSLYYRTLLHRWWLIVKSQQITIELVIRHCLSDGCLCFSLTLLSNLYSHTCRRGSFIYKFHTSLGHTVHPQTGLATKLILLPLIFVIKSALNCLEGKSMTPCLDDMAPFKGP